MEAFAERFSALYRRLVILSPRRHRRKMGQAMDILVQKTRKEGGLKPNPIYGIIDSQSAKTTSSSQEWRYDGRKIKVVSDILSSTRWGICSRCLFMQQTFMIRNRGLILHEGRVKSIRLLCVFTETTVIANPLKT